VEIRFVFEASKVCETLIETIRPRRCRKLRKVEVRRREGTKGWDFERGSFDSSGYGIELQRAANELSEAAVHLDQRLRIDDSNNEVRAILRWEI
jgi:hypothetical protein